MRKALTLFGFLGGVALLSACKADVGTGVFANTGGGSGQGGNTGSAGTVGTASGNPSGGGNNSSGEGGLGDFDGGMATTGSGPSACTSAPGEDNDHDGFAVPEDCNDCDANVNPSAVEVIATMDSDGGVPPAVDENCDGMIDNVQPACDIGLPVGDNDPMNAAKAVDLCRVAANDKDWGVVSAKWVLPDGSPPPAGMAFDLGHGLLTGFGPNVKVQAGGRMLGLSSGTARQVTDPGYMSVGGYTKGYTSQSPMGFPKESPACPGVTTGAVFDAAGLEVTVRAPSNAHGFSFNFNFFTYEWPQYICSQFNDFFVALLSPIPMGQTDGNISFDSQGNPVSVNNAFIEVCGCAGGPPCQAGGKTFSCSLGNSGLVGTGFQDQFSDHGSTGWLFSKAPVNPGQQITMRWAVYDSGDGALDSTTLIDNWQWIAEPGTEVGTGVVPPPK